MYSLEEFGPLSPSLFPLSLSSPPTEEKRMEIKFETVAQVLSSFFSLSLSLSLSYFILSFLSLCVMYSCIGYYQSLACKRIGSFHSRVRLLVGFDLVGFLLFHSLWYQILNRVIAWDTEADLPLLSSSSSTSSNNNGLFFLSFIFHFLLLLSPPNLKDPKQIPLSTSLIEVNLRLEELGISLIDDTPQECVSSHNIKERERERKLTLQFYFFLPTDFFICPCSLLIFLFLLLLLLYLLKSLLLMHK